MGASERLPALVKRWVQPITDFWSEKLWLDYVAAVLVVSIHAIFIHVSGSGDWLLWIKSDQRIGVYGTAATIISAIGGLSAIAITVYIAVDGKRARAAKALYEAELRRNWRGLLGATGFTAVLCLLAQAIDTDGDPRKARFVFEFAISLAIIRFFRLLWLFDWMMRVSVPDSNETQQPPTPEYDSSWAE